jgi:hypothetical protein
MDVYNNNNGVKFSFSNVKIEKGNVATDYTTAPEDNEGLYTWIKYADNINGGGMSDDPTNKDYIGIAYNKDTDVKSTVASDYNWSLFRGPQGIQGEQGLRGIEGPQGPNGQTLYTWLKYADTSTGSGMSDSPTGKKYMGLAYNKTTPTESSVTTDYAWSLIQGVQGVKGDDGVTTYTWVKYADTSTGMGLSDSPTGKKYIGLAYNKTTPTESTTASDYAWSLIQGDKGDTGATLYTWIKYADSPTSGISDSPTGKKYMGIAYNKTTAIESNTYVDYSWSLIEGPKGLTGSSGSDGADGITYYTWVKYGTSSAGAGMSDSPTGKTYIGLAYNKTTATESTNPADYTWSLIQGPQGAKGDKGDTGAAGKDGVAHMGTTAPSNPATNSTWFKTDASGKVISIEKWSGSAWVAVKMDSQALNVATLSALSANLGNITAGTLNAVELVGATGTFSGSVSSPVFEVKSNSYATNKYARIELETGLTSRTGAVVLSSSNEGLTITRKHDSYQAFFRLSAIDLDADLVKTYDDLQVGGTISEDGVLLTNKYARVNAYTDGYIWARRSTTGATLYVTNQSTGYIASFRSGSGDGAQQSYISNNGTYVGDVSSNLVTTEEVALSNGTYNRVGASASGDGVYLYAGSANTYAKMKNDGAFFIVVNGSTKHTFYAGGTKSGGSIVIDGENLGMSPIDSPQILLEYIEFNVPLSESGTKVYLEPRYSKAVEDFAVFANNGSVVEKGDDYFIVSGEGTADVRIIGERIGYADVFFDDIDAGNELEAETDAA